MGKTLMTNRIFILYTVVMLENVPIFKKCMLKYLKEGGRKKIYLFCKSKIISESKLKNE